MSESHTKEEDKPCCPEFDRTPWDDKTHVWNDKPFIKDSIPVFFHIPWPPMIGRLLMRMWGKAQKAGAAPDIREFLALACDPTPWRTEYYLAVNREVPDAENVRLSGTFFSRVFDGPYRSVPKWIKQLAAEMAKQGKTPKQYYFHYTTCPKCAKLHGHNYVVGFVQVD
jgi:hypothetical protein